MGTVYLVCAVAGGTILVVQTILLVMGGDTDSAEMDADTDVGGGHVDVDHDVHHDVHHDDASQATFFKVLSFKTLVAFFTFFGLTGLACQEAGMEFIWSLLIAFGAGSVALYLVAYLMSMLYRLQSRGNVNLANATGRIGKVYLRIPGQNAGMGKVNVVIQGRLVECKAITSGREIATGEEVEVVGTSGPGTVEVLPVRKE